MPLPKKTKEEMQEFHDRAEERRTHQRAVYVAECFKNMFEICRTRCANCGDLYGAGCMGCTFGAGVGILELLFEKFSKIAPEAANEVMPAGHGNRDSDFRHPLFAKDDFTTFTTNLALSAAATEIYLFLKDHGEEWGDDYEFNAYFKPFMTEYFEKHKR